eukprot:gnl/Chilomastix_cuspidata/1530.p2 GENE.gnl/Chilomastix_cuspidata/1530~~gnl/Chilomastix_cuspidata/1530.p2  ORF type:complete len:457 (+),score=205.34 gnl/Chilomastix_cuspidata/1530:1837-3207(+)
MNTHPFALKFSIRALAAFSASLRACRALSGYVRLRVTSKKMMLDCLNSTNTSRMKVNFPKGFFEDYEVSHSVNFVSWFEARVLIQILQRNFPCQMRFAPSDNCLSFFMQAHQSRLSFRVPLMETTTMRDPSALTVSVDESRASRISFAADTLQDALSRLKGLRADVEAVTVEGERALQFRSSEESGGFASVLLNAGSLAQFELSEAGTPPFSVGPHDLLEVSRLVKRLEVPQLLTLVLPRFGMDATAAVLRSPRSAAPHVVLYTSASQNVEFPSVSSASATADRVRSRPSRSSSVLERMSTMTPAPKRPATPTGLSVQRLDASQTPPAAEADVSASPPSFAPTVATPPPQLATPMIRTRLPISALRRAAEADSARPAMSVVPPTPSPFNARAEQMSAPGGDTPGALSFLATGPRSPAPRSQTEVPPTAPHDTPLPTEDGYTFDAAEFEAQLRSAFE